MLKLLKMQSNNGSIVHSLYVQIQNFRPYEHLNDVYLCSCKECAAVWFYRILFGFPPLSLVTIGPLKQLMVSLRMEEHFIRNVTRANMFLFLICQRN